jgi:hypothetical protein
MIVQEDICLHINDQTLAVDKIRYMLVDPVLTPETCHMLFPERFLLPFPKPC